MTAIHSYTNDQNVLDFPHKDLRRARAAAVSMIPTTTGAAKAIGLVMPELKGRLTATPCACPLPTSRSSILSANAKDTHRRRSQRRLEEEAAEGPLKGILGYTEDPVVSTDMMRNSNSSIVDSDLTKVMGGNMVKVISWYDNEWGYSCRVIDLIVFPGEKRPLAASQQPCVLRGVGHLAHAPFSLRHSVRFPHQYFRSFWL